MSTIQYRAQCQPKTMFDKIWEAHVVRSVPGELTILYIDRHLVHEVTSPQAFAGLKTAGRAVRRSDATVAVLDHNVPTVNGRRMLDVVDQESSLSITTMEQNARGFGLTLYDMQDTNQGIVHVIGPELGITLPGMTLVCGDSAYFNAWCTGCLRYRDWYERGGACAGNAVSLAAEAEDDEYSHRGYA